MLIVNTHAHARNAIAYLAPLGIPPRSLALRAPGGSAPAPLRGAPPAKPQPRQVARKRARTHGSPSKVGTPESLSNGEGKAPGKPRQGERKTNRKRKRKTSAAKKERESGARLIRIKKEGGNYVLLFLYPLFTPYNPPFFSFMVSQKYEIKQGQK